MLCGAKYSACEGKILFKRKKRSSLQTNADFRSTALPLFSGNIELQRRVIHTQYFYFLLSSRLKARIDFLKSTAFCRRICYEADISAPPSGVNASVPPASCGGVPCTLHPVFSTEQALKMDKYL